MANFEQAYNVLNEVARQATGREDLTAVDTTSFVAVANTVLRMGVDVFFNTLSDVLSRTIFSYRPYEPIFDVVSADEERWGNHVRKVVPLDFEAVENEEYTIEDGHSYDPWVVAKDKVLQFNYYDGVTHARNRSYPVDQVRTACTGPEEFSYFTAMLFSNARSLINVDEENARRLCVCNFIAGKTLVDARNVRHLLTEYNTVTGQSLTATTVMQNVNYIPFMQWVSAQIESASMHLRERGYKYHMNLTDANIPRHTPKNYQRFIMMSDDYARIKNSVLSNTFNEEYIKGFEKFEAVNFLQSENTPNSVSVTPKILTASGTVADGTETTVNNFFAMIFDRDAMLHTTIDTSSYTTPINGRTKHYNVWWHYTNRYCNDFTENAIMFLLD